MSVDYLRLEKGASLRCCAHESYSPFGHQQNSVEESEQFRRRLVQRNDDRLTARYDITAISH